MFVQVQLLDTRTKYDKEENCEGYDKLAKIKGQIVYSSYLITFKQFAAQNPEEALQLNKLKIIK